MQKYNFHTHSSLEQTQGIILKIQSNSIDNQNVLQRSKFEKLFEKIIASYKIEPNRSWRYNIVYACIE